MTQPPVHTASTADTLAPANGKVAVITGAARRIGAHIARHLHQQGFTVIIHYRHSEAEAQALATTLNQSRANSALIVQQDLSATDAGTVLADKILALSERIDVLINNASRFYPTTANTVSETDWDELVGSNFKAPYFLSCALADTLTQHQGCIVNMADIYAEKPLSQHSLYCAAKAALVMATRALARDLAPAVRVNAIAPGPILWPEHNSTESQQSAILNSIPLARTGTPEDIANAIDWLVHHARFTTGQVINVDGGRALVLAES